ncbi:hypothetical protein Tco_0810314 [Tanacetum coccineum]
MELDRQTGLMLMFVNGITKSTEGREPALLRDGVCFDDINLRYMGGMWIMIDFKTEDTKAKFQSCLGATSWFSLLIQASKEFVIDERITWVDIEGIPLKLWSESTFNRIAAKWGIDAFYLGKLDEGGKRFLVRAKETMGWIPDFDEQEEDNSESEESYPGVNLLIISVYAPQEYAEKKMLWDYLVHVISKWDGEVIVFGDLMRSIQNEKICCYSCSWPRAAFNRLFCMLDLQEITLRLNDSVRSGFLMVDSFISFWALVLNGVGGYMNALRSSRGLGFSKWEVGGVGDVCLGLNHGCEVIDKMVNRLSKWKSESFVFWEVPCWFYQRMESIGVTVLKGNVRVVKVNVERGLASFDIKVYRYGLGSGQARRWSCCRIGVELGMAASRCGSVAGGAGRAGMQRVYRRMSVVSGIESEQSGSSFGQYGAVVNV